MGDWEKHFPKISFPHPPLRGTFSRFAREKDVLRKKRFGAVIYKGDDSTVFTETVSAHPVVASRRAPAKVSSETSAGASPSK